MYMSMPVGIKVSKLSSTIPPMSIVPTANPLQVFPAVFNAVKGCFLFIDGKKHLQAGSVVFFLRAK